MSSEVAVKVSNVSKHYHIYDRPLDRLKQSMFRGKRQYFTEFKALDNVSFEIKKGETVGIIGRNGSGKSTLLQMICGTLTPTSGQVAVNGRVAALLELGTGFNPEFTGRENVYMNASILGLSQVEIDNSFLSIVEFANIGNFIDQPVKTYSSGMYVRLAFSVAINVHPDVLIVDEALAVGDASFQRKCMRKINELAESGVTLLFVSHDTNMIKTICSKAVYISNGMMCKFGNAKDVCTEYERDLFGASNGKKLELNTVEEDKEESTAKGAYDSELISSEEKVYGNGDAVINKIHISNIDEEQVNVLPVQESFVVSYEVKFKSSAKRPVFGMMIRTREGVCVFGVNTRLLSISNKNYKSGDVVNISFALTNNLGAGIYYLTCGVYTNDDESEDLVYLQRRMDVYIFRSLGEDNVAVSGMVSLVPSIQCVKS